jgi:hypothetical protein
MSSLASYVDTTSWPGVNKNAFWSLCERVDDTFVLENADELRAEYVFNNAVDGKLLRAPFDGLYNLYIESWNNAQVDKAILYLNQTPLEVCEGPEINFDTFTETNPLPIALMHNDELRIVLKLASPGFIPKSLGSARMMRFNWKTTDQPFVVVTTCSCAIMYDGHQLRAVSHVEEDSDNETSASLENLLQSITGTTPDPEAFRRALSLK